MRVLKILSALVLLLTAAAFVYGFAGYLDARADAFRLSARADRLIAGGRGGVDLGPRQLAKLLQVEDPGFVDHSGVDLSSAGGGLTTITQSLAKRVGFETFQPGIAKIRQTGYAIGLEHELTKQEILALWLDTLEMGQGPDGWMTGFFRASNAIYGKAPADLTEREFLSLVAVLIAPSTYHLGKDDPKLEDRVARIERLVAGSCTPLDNGDVWLEGCRDK